MNKPCLHEEKTIIKVEGPQLLKSDTYCDPPLFETIYNKWCNKCGAFYDGLRGIWNNPKS